MTATKMFLAIPYAEEFAWVRDTIAAACREFDVSLRSVDEVISPGGEILSAIQEEIETTDIATAVISGLNPNVLYELGRLHQASKPTIILASSDTPAPFDVASFSRISYEPDSSLRSELQSVFAGALSKLLFALSKEGRSEIASGSYKDSGLSRSGKAQETRSVLPDFDEKRRQAEKMLGKSDCKRTEAEAFDTASFKGWHLRIACPDGDKVLILIDLNGEIKRAKVEN